MSQGFCLPLLYSLFCTDFDGVIEGMTEVAEKLQWVRFLPVNICISKRQAFPIGKVTFQGRAVKLPRCTTKQSRKQNKKKVPA